MDDIYIGIIICSILIVGILIYVGAKRGWWSSATQEIQEDYTIVEQKVENGFQVAKEEIEQVVASHKKKSHHKGKY